MPIVTPNHLVYPTPFDCLNGTINEHVTDGENPNMVKQTDKKPLPLDHSPKDWQDFLHFEISQLNGFYGSPEHEISYWLIT